MTPNRTLEVYVAGASREASRALLMVKRLEAEGLIVTDRWFDTADDWAGKDKYYDELQQADLALAHERALREASIFWLLWPQKLSYGALYELGYANCHRWHTGPRRRLVIVVSGPGCAETIYTARADSRHQHDELGLAAVLQAARIQQVAR